MSAPWPLLRQLRQGDIEQTALVDANGEVVARVAAPEAYQGDLRTAIENGDLTAEIVSSSAAAPELLAGLKQAAAYIGQPSDSASLDDLDEDDTARLHIDVRIGDIKAWLAAIARAEGRAQ